VVCSPVSPSQHLDCAGMWTVCNDWFERREGGRRGYAMIPDFRALFAGRVELAPASRPQSHTWPAPLCAAIALCAACSDALVRGRPLSALRLLSVRRAQMLSFCTACTWQGGVRTTGPCLMTCDIQRGQSCVYHLCEPYFSDSERLRSFKFHCGWETKPL